MSTLFPVSLDVLTNPTPTSTLVTDHAEQHSNANDAIEALQTKVGITGSADITSLDYQLSAAGKGAALAALTAKVTPVDADVISLSDSAASGVLKKFSWSSLKTALQSVFATLAGVAGGQTLNGGTAAGETLTLRSTAHATKGKLLFGTSAYDEVNNRLGIGTVSPAAPLEVSGNIYCNNQLRLNNNTGAITTAAGSQILYFNDTLKETRLVSLYSGGFASIYTGSPNLERVRIDGSGNIGFGVTPSTYQLDAAHYQWKVGAENNLFTRTDNVVKTFRLSCAHYSNEEDPVGILFMQTPSDTQGILSFGGGSSLTNAATEHRFYTASDAITPIGTQAMTITNAQRVVIGATAASAKFHVVDAAEQQRLGYDVANYLSTTVSSTGAVTYSATGGQYIFKGINSTAVLGSDLVTNGSFTSDLTGWTDSGSSWSWVAGSADHTPGSASNLTQSITVTSGNTYRITVVISGRSAGSVSFTLGSVPMVDYATVSAWSVNGTFFRTLVATASGAVTLTITPTTTFDGAVDSIVVQNVTLGSVTSTQVFQNSDGSTGFQMRSGGSAQWNTFIGTDAGRSIINGYNNSVVGANALRAVTTGINNTAMGYASLNLCTIGSVNTAFGSGSAQSVSTGYANVAVGYQSLNALTTGQYCNAIGSNSASALTSSIGVCAFGYASLIGMTAGSNVIAMGTYSGRYIADGVSANATCDNSVFLGNSTKALASGQTNQTVIGYNAVGLGSNTSVIGSSATVTFKAFGTPILTPAASSVPTVNGELTVEATSNTTLTFRLKGTDGTVRSVALTLA